MAGYHFHYHKRNANDSPVAYTPVRPVHRVRDCVRPTFDHIEPKNVYGLRTEQTRSPRTDVSVVPQCTQRSIAKSPVSASQGAGAPRTSNIVHRSHSSLNGVFIAWIVKRGYSERPSNCQSQHDDPGNPDRRRFINVHTAAYNSLKCRARALDEVGQIDRQTTIERLAGHSSNDRPSYRDGRVLPCKNCRRAFRSVLPRARCIT